VTSDQPPAGGLVAAYLDQANTPPGPPEPAGPVGPWATAIAADLAAAQVPVITAYPVGRHTLDICIDDRSRNLGIVTGVHPLGPAAHIERHLALVRTGWTLLEAFPSRWGERRAELVVELLRATGRLAP
jgi:hypothetical protein